MLLINGIHLIQIFITLAVIRGGSSTAATSKMKRFMIIVNGFKPLTIITKHSILDVATVLDPPLNIFRNALLKFIRPAERKIFNICDPFAIKMLTRLILGFDHLHENKFRLGFKDTVNPCYSCSTEPETTTH